MLHQYPSSSTIIPHNTICRGRLPSIIDLTLSKKYVCDQCQYETYNIYYSLEHKKNHFYNDFHEIYSLHENSKESTEPDFFICDQCKFITSDRYSYLLHISKRISDRNRVCNTFPPTTTKTFYNIFVQ